MIGKFREPEDIILELRHVDRSLMNIKRQARARYGPRRSEWPADIRAEIDQRKAQAIAYRQELGMRK